MGAKVGLTVGVLEGADVGLGVAASVLVKVTARLAAETVAATFKVTEVPEMEVTVPDEIPLAAVAVTTAPTAMELATADDTTIVFDPEEVMAVVVTVCAIV